MRMTLMRAMRTIPITLAAFLLLAGCGQDANDEAETKKRPATSTEVAEPEPRLAVTHAGGVVVLDAEQGTVLLEHELEGFTRLNPAGAGRHALLSPRTEARGVGKGCVRTGRDR